MIDYEQWVFFLRGETLRSGRGRGVGSEWSDKWGPEEWYYSASLTEVRVSRRYLYVSKNWREDLWELEYPDVILSINMHRKFLDFLRNSHVFHVCQLLPMNIWEMITFSYFLRVLASFIWNISEWVKMWRSHMMMRKIHSWVSFIVNTRPTFWLCFILQLRFSSINSINGIYQYRHNHKFSCQF